MTSALNTTGTAVAALLIEDDEDDYLIARDLLASGTGRYEICWEPDAAAGLATLVTGAHDVCLLDYRLGATTGLDLLARARAAGCDTPVILLTGQSDGDTDLQAMRAGASDYLEKGRLDSPTLERAIRYSLERRRAMQALEASEGQFRSLMESARDGIIIARADGQIASCNPSALSMFDELSFSGRSIGELLRHPRDATVLDLSESTSDSGDVLDLVAVRRDGATFPAEVSLSSWPTGDGLMWSAIIRDVTDRRALERQLEYQAFHDPLTGLANRALLRSRLEHAVTAAADSYHQVGVLLLDVDDFKRVNDTLGHAAGDELLCQIGGRLAHTIRGVDTAARLGGDEFAVVVEDVQSTDELSGLAQRLADRLREPFDIGGRIVEISASIGIAVTGDLSDTATLMQHADVAMYSAKEAGKNRHILFRDQMHERIVSRIALETDLRGAVAGEQLMVHYQPVVDLNSDEIVAVEALMRWSHPRRGLVPPDNFIGTAEQTGLIVGLGRALRMSAFDQIRRWQDLGVADERLRLMVNVSPREIESDEFVEAVFGDLDRAGVAASTLTIEITEGAMLSKRSLVIGRLAQLRNHGVEIAIDDFGTGYSSLSYLQELPADLLKIDRSFTARLGEDAGRNMVATIIALSRSLGFATIAEGIEESSTIEELQRLGCSLGQGYHLARPATAADIELLLRSPRRLMVG